MALSGSLKTSTHDGRGLQLSWSATQSVANNSSTVSWTLKPFGGSDSWYTTGPITVKINGQTVYNFTGRTDMRLTWSTSGTITIPHGEDGKKSFSVSVSAAIYYYAVNCTGSATYTLDPIARTPSAPTAFTITAGYGNYVGLGDTITLNWSGASGTITGYELQYSYGSNGWQDWKTQTGTSTTVSFAGRTDISQTGAGKAIKYRVRALNGTFASGWKESNTLTMIGGMDLKVGNTWKNGTVWINVNGTWKRAKRVYVKVNNTWKYSI